MKPTMQFTALLSVLIVSLAACLGTPKGSETPDIKATALSTLICASQDEKLSIALRDREAAQAYLDDLLERLGKDPEATREAADIIARIQECL